MNVLNRGTGLLNLGALSPSEGRAQVVAAIEASREYLTRVVDNLYTTLLGRSADPGGEAGFVADLANGMTVEQVKAVILGSPEYFRLHRSDNGAWLNAVYQDLLSRPNWENAHVDALVSLSRETVAGGILNSIEAATQQVDLDYRQYLGRSSFQDRGAAGFAKQLLAGTMTNEQIIAGFVGSQEYFENHNANVHDWLFGAYQSVLSRQPDPTGFNSWMHALGQ